MATKIRLMRLGKIRMPQYRIVISDSRNKRDGKYIESIGQYRPKEDPSFILVNSERAQYWLSVGAQPTEPVLTLLKLTGDWQRFKGLPGENRVKVAEPKQSRASRAEFAAGRVQELAVVQEKAKAEKKKTEKKKTDKVDDSATKSEAAPKTKAKDTAAQDATAKGTVKSDATAANAQAPKVQAKKVESADAVGEPSDKPVDGQV